MKNVFAVLFIVGFSQFANADLPCISERQDGGMFVKCDDGRDGFLDDRIPTDDIIDIAYLVKLKSGSKLIGVKGTELKELLNGQYQKHSRYPLAEKLAPFMNTKYKMNLTASDIVRVEPRGMHASPSIKIYSKTTDNGKQKKFISYGNVPEVDAVPIPIPGRAANKSTQKNRAAQ